MVLRFGLLGVGMIGEKHAHHLASGEAGTSLVAIAASRRESASRLADRCRVPALSYQEMLARDDIDAILVATPSGLHAEHTCAALRAGKHVLLEKSIDVDLAAADAIIAAERSSGRTVGIVGQRRFTPVSQYIHQVVVAGGFGRVTSASVSQPLWRSQEYYDSAAWRGTREFDGGVLMQQGFHLVDLMLWMLGPAVEVKAVAATSAHLRIDVEDVAAVCSRHEGGALLSLFTTTAAAEGAPTTYGIFGTEGFVVVHGEAIAQLSLSPNVGLPPPPNQPGDDGRLGQLRDFVEAVRAERPPLITTTDGRDALSYICRAYESAVAPALISDQGDELYLTAEVPAR